MCRIGDQKNKFFSVAILATLGQMLWNFQVEHISIWDVCVILCTNFYPDWFRFVGSYSRKTKSDNLKCCSILQHNKVRNTEIMVFNSQCHRQHRDCVDLQHHFRHLDFQHHLHLHCHLPQDKLHLGHFWSMQGRASYHLQRLPSEDGIQEDVHAYRPTYETFTIDIIILF